MAELDPDRGPLGACFTPIALAEELAGPLSEGSGPILDPACGDGELLLAAARARPGAELHGIELDPASAERARERLAAELGKEAARNIRCVDALDPGIPWPAGTDIVANPPWVSLSGRQRVALADDRRALYRSAWAAARGSWPSLHGAFLERIAVHLGAAGRQGATCRARLLLPSSVGQHERYGSLRGDVTRHARLSATPIDLGEDAFPGVVEPAFLIELTGRDTEIEGSQTAWSWRVTAPEERQLLAHLADFPRLAACAFADPGVHTGNAARELIVNGNDPTLPGVRVGRDLAPYCLSPPAHWLRTDLSRTPERRFRIGTRERYENVPILLRQTADRPMAALHDEPTYFRNSLLACTPPAELDPAFVVGVLNAPVAAAWHRLSFHDAGQRAFPQVKVGHLRTQPFPIARRDENPELHDRVAELVCAAREDAEAAACSEALVVEAFGLTAAERAVVERLRAPAGSRASRPSAGAGSTR